MHPHKVFLSLGSNLGDRVFQIEKAFQEIRSIPGVAGLLCSQLYETTPVSPLPQPNFINAACSFFTSLSPLELLDHLQRIEINLGKLPKKKIEPRPIDIDILLFGELCINTPHLQIPHPAMLDRLFVLLPLSELANTLLVPQAHGSPQRLNLDHHLKQFKNPHNETCAPLSFVPGPVPVPDLLPLPLLSLLN